MGGINGVKKDEIVNRQLCHWFRADMNLGLGIAKGLELNLDKAMEGMVHPDPAHKATNE
jgi:catalase